MNYEYLIVFSSHLIEIYVASTGVYVHSISTNVKLIHPDLLYCIQNDQMVQLSKIFDTMKYSNCTVSTTKISGILSPTSTVSSRAMLENVIMESKTVRTKLFLVEDSDEISDEV